jgi:heme exporter protein B
MMRVFIACLRRDLLLALRRRTDVLASLFFFIIVASLFPLSIGPEEKTLRLIAPGVVWVAALLASMLSLPRMFESDYADGSLEQLMLLPQPLFMLVLAKALAHWLVSGLALSLVSVLLALQYQLSSDSLLVLVISLILGTPVLSLVGAIGAALTLGLKGGSVLLSLLVLPLYIPLLIFGAGAVEANASGLGATPYFSILGACLAMSIVLCPMAAALALKISME